MDGAGTAEAGGSAAPGRGAAFPVGGPSWGAAAAPANAAWRTLAVLDGWVNRLYGSRWNPLYQSGAMTVALLVVVLVTGLYLLLYYRLGSPWESVARLTDQAWSGRWIRGLHRYASDGLVVTASVHAFRMYAQRRTWGPRTLAWVSGVALVGVILVCGWTGYVMVWDVQAQVLAVEGARFLDVLPIFSEPISRAFVGEYPLPSAFFFLNLFAHVALPVGLALLVWVHVSRVARPVLLPPRPLLWAVVGGFTALSLLWPVGMAPKADVLTVPGSVPLDVFYGFWLPVTRLVPAWAVWAAGVPLVAVLLLVPIWTRPRAAGRPARSRVDERSCTGCEQCALDCPYDAISMLARADGRQGSVARVNTDACVSCGICAGSCAPMGVGPGGRTGRDQLSVARGLGGAEGGVVVVACSRSAGGRFSGPDIRTLSVECAGNLHTSVVETLLRGGAAGVLVVACPGRDCWNREGGRWLHARVHEGREAELQARVDRSRVRLCYLSAREADRLRAEIADFAAALPPPAGGTDRIDLVAECERAAAGEAP
jgi:coenzyme F420-reducing hydrogenase delta subunit/Pyruvate/2-oxoacid:ferredoxin oxidoreductase delta subunit